jgi:hypothetical protein
MTGRKCSSCKHYEPAPIWRKGWCRNPLLYSPQQSHLVGEDDLDCERGMGNYWEAVDPSQSFATVGAGVDVDSGGFRESVSDAFAAVSTTDDAAFVPPAALNQPPRVYAVSGGSVGDPPDAEPPISGSGGGRGGRDRQVTYYADDRYWTDYLRIAAPILGVLLMVALFWFWASSFLGDDNKNNTTGGVAGTTTALPIIGSTPGRGTPTAKASPVGTLTIVKTPVAQEPTATTAPDEGPAPTEDTGGATTDETPPGGAGVYNGAQVKVAGTGGTGANLRADASADADVIAVELDGTVLTTTGEAVTDADGNTWWPVSGDDGEGFIVADYLELVQ